MLSFEWSICLELKDSFSTTEYELKKILGARYKEISPYISYEEYPSIFTYQESKDTWHEFYDKIDNFHIKYKKNMHEAYIYGLKNLSYHRSYIPNLNQLSYTLKPWGWRALWVKGYVPAKVYATLIANGYFPISCNIRRKIHLEHSPIPDFIHDVWGHLPLLYDSEYTRYIKEIAIAIENAKHNEYDHLLYEAESKLAILKHEQAPENSSEFISTKQSLLKAQDLADRFPSIQMKLARIFLWSIEFGLIKTSNEEIKIVGSGILSAPFEFLNIINGNLILRTYSIDVTQLSLKYFSDLQSQFFTIPDFHSWRVILAQFLEEESII